MSEVGILEKVIDMAVKQNSSDVYKWAKLKLDAEKGIIPPEVLAASGIKYHEEKPVCQPLCSPDDCTCGASTDYLKGEQRPERAPEPKTETFILIHEIEDSKSFLRWLKETGSGLKDAITEGIYDCAYLSDYEAWVEETTNG